jgi:hypothetical protein
MEVIYLLFICQRANASRDRITRFGIEVKGIVGHPGKAFAGRQLASYRSLDGI